ncbi:MAG: choice-of-anchor D domain-containing protein [bacterium]|nr:choice-of-anchor D domain-containing protein [bacterium]
MILASLALVLIPGGPAGGSPAEFAVPVVEFALAAQDVDEDGGAVTVKVKLSEIHADDVSVPYTLSGSAILGVDFTVDPSPLLIPAGNLTADIGLTLLDDLLHEFDETIVLTLGTPTNATLGAETVHTVTILDDDSPPTVDFQSPRAQAREDVGVVHVPVVLDAAAGRDVTIPFLHSGSAQHPADYSIVSSPLVIAAGQTTATIDITLVDDAMDEQWERVRIDLDAGLEGATAGRVVQYDLLVIDDDGITSDPVVQGLRPGAGVLAFPSQRVGETLAMQTLTLMNTQSTAIALVGAVVEGEHPSDFQPVLPGGLPLTLEPGDAVGIDVAFVPTTGGLRRANLLIVQSPSGVPETRVQLQGTAYGQAGAEVLVNAGPAPFNDSLGQQWAADHGFAGGAHLVWPGPIDGTVDDPLYHVARFGPSFHYGFELPNGVYELRLSIADTVMTQTGWRVFDVVAEGATLLDDLDLVAVAGTRTAWQSPALRVDLQDGTFDLDFAASVGDALVSALEIRSVPVLAALEPEFDFGAVDPGGSAELALSLTNSGLHDGHLTSVTFELDAQSYGSGEEFYVEIAGVQFHGGATTVVHAVDLPIPAGQTTLLPVFFKPSVHADHRLTLRLEGDFEETLETTLIATGAAGIGWGYLHPVLAQELDPVVDYDSDGGEVVGLIGFASHTHESGRSIVGWEWAEGGLPFSTAPDPTRLFPAGESIVELTITDDGGPPSSATDSMVVEVHPVHAVPGVLASYYEDPGTGTVFLLDNVPSHPDYIGRIEDLRVEAQGGLVGGSPFAGGVMVRLRASFDVAQEQAFHFVATGGVDTRVEVDGAPHTQATVLAVGAHALEARFAIDDLGDLPAVLTASIGGQPAPSFGASLTHDLSVEPPLIHEMPSTGSDAGGIPITIRGFALLPPDSVVVHWGGTDLDGAYFTSWSPTELRFLSPPGSGSVQVSVETPAGTSPLRTYTYLPSGPVPPAWTELASVNLGAPTTAAFGPDGRLYVGQLSGHITAITFDEDYAVTAMQQYAGVSGLTNYDLCGLAFAPYDDPLGPVRIYVAHGEHWLNGGGSFPGPSDFTGQVSLLTGPDFDAPQGIITQLPTSNHDHGVNGLVFDGNGDLLICVGGNTNAGVRWPTIGDVPESPLSGAIVKAVLSKPGFDGQVLYEHSTTGQPVDDQVLGGEIDVASGVDVFVHAMGLRNAYDLVLTTRGLLYATDNGPNNGFGPASTGPSSQAGHAHAPDELLLIERGDYYGHPNRSRGRYEPRENVYKDPWVVAEPEIFVQATAILEASTNGICEYRSTCFNSAIRGQLVVQKWNELPSLIELGADGRSVVSVTPIAVPALNGLDVIAGPGGALLATHFTFNRLEIMVPNDVAATGLVAYDITPWRAPAGGGQRFVIGGEGFGSLADTDVRFGGAPATLTAVSARRIIGLVPPSVVGATDLMDIEVQVGIDAVLISDAFKYMQPVPGMELGTWRAGAELPVPLELEATAVLGDALYGIAGGVPAAYAYDLGAGTWSPVSAPALVGDRNACVGLDEKLFLFGGTGAASGKVQIYDAVLGTWSQGADMPWLGAGSSAVAVGNQIHVMGGQVGTSVVSDHGVYDPGSDTWNPAGPPAPMPTAVADAAIGTDGTRVFVFGGRSVAAPSPGLDVVQVYDPNTDIWDTSDQPGATLEPMPLARAGTRRAVHYFGEFLVIGGASGSLAFEDVHAYDPVANTWRTDAPLPAARHAIAPVRFQSRVFVAGGSSAPGSPPSARLEVFTDQ